MTEAELKRVSLAIKARMKQLKIKNARGLAEALGYEGGERARVYNWIAGNNGPDIKAREYLIQKLGLDPAVFAGIEVNTPSKPRSKTKPGIVQRAMALAHADQANGGQALVPAQAQAHTHTTVVSDVFSCRVRSDGTMQVKLDTNLPLMQGMALMKFLMEFGLVADQQQGSA